MDRVKEYIQLIALVLFIVIALMFLLGVSCMSGYCSTHDCNKRKEGFTGPAMQTMSLGGYNRLCRFGEGGIWFDCSRGAGEYVDMGRETTGFYEPPVEGSDVSGIHSPKTPECMRANCGRFDEPKNPQGCGCNGVQACCGRNRGCKSEYMPYYAEYECTK